MKNFLLISAMLLIVTLLTDIHAQQVGKPLIPDGNSIKPAQIARPVKPGQGVPSATPVFLESRSGYMPLPPLQKRVKGHAEMVIVHQEDNLPVVIKGTPTSIEISQDLETQVTHYLTAIGEAIKVKETGDAFQTKQVQQDEQGNFHIRMNQYYQGVKVYGSEIILHTHHGIVDMFNGRYYPTPVLESVLPTVSYETARSIAQADVAGKVNSVVVPEEQLWLIGGEQCKLELVIYHQGTTPVLAWHIQTYPNIMSRWEYFIDATTGGVLHAFESLCNATHHHVPEHQLPDCPPGPTTANVQDLQGITRTLNVYEQGGMYYMIDGSRSMFNLSQSNIPNSPVGAIITLNAQNTSPANNNFNYIFIQDNDNNWGTSLDIKKTCSAHYNAGQAYTYFKNTFNRQSINGSGGNIISLINVADQNGSGMDNAFWNGEAMFYGNGNQAFSPLAEALDVGGHEMSHGVIEKTANLTYQGESGALNESFADIFGAMIDRDDWKMGEDITNTAFFPTGALRDLSNPNNGGNSFDDNGYQPDHVDDKYTGSGDNGGVHINSGITNYAYYLFASNGNVGKEKAEQVFYKALRDYLVMSSKFIDLRASVLSAIDDLNYNQSVTDAAINAFSQVGIGGGGSSGGAVYQVNLSPNPGDEYLMYTDINGSGIWMSETDGSNEFIVTNTNLRSKPSITDNGTEIIFIGADKKMYYITINWSTGTINEFVIQDEPIWRNAVFSKDGWKVAATFDQLEDEIWVYSFQTETDNTFQLYNPTTAEGIETGEVQYADAMEWDHAGEYVMYDAYNLLNNSSGADISYWDIGFLRAWKNSTNNFGDGYIDKLFSGLPANTSVADPAFSKNSPYIMAFDFIDSNNGTYSIYGANLQTGNTDLIFENDQLGYPNYSNLDNKVIFNAEDTNGDAVIGQRSVQSNKITGIGNAVGLVYGYWGSWFANGNRNLLIGTENINPAVSQLYAFPNPFNTEIAIDIAADVAQTVHVTLYNIVGHTLIEKETTLSTGKNLIELDTEHLSAGTYILNIRVGEQMTVRKLVKL